METNNEILEMVQKIRTMKQLIKDTEVEIELLKQRIEDFMGDEEDLTYNGVGICKYAFTEGAMRLDTQKLKLMHPKIYEAFCTKGKSVRKFMLL